jgi:hypothetical protein
MQRDFKWYGLLISCLTLMSNTVLADPLPTRFSANAYTGAYTVGLADLMLSLDGDEVHNLYVDPQAAYGSDQQWFADLGLGYRWINNDAAILGWYAFAGRTHVSNNSDFWVANPGVEILGRRWDAPAAITLNAGQSVHSRTSDYAEPATDTARSTFNGAFILNSNNTLENIILLPTLSTAAENAISATNATNVLVSASQIGSATNRYIETAIFLSGSQLSLDNSSVFSSRRAIRAQANSSLSVESSQIDVTQTIGGGITGISITNSNAEINNTQLSVIGRGRVVGITALSDAMVSLNSTNVITGSISSLAIGLLTNTNGSIFMEGGELSVSGSNAQLTSGSNILLIGVTCTLHGTSFIC